MENKKIKLYEKPCHQFSDEVTLELYLHTYYEEITKQPRPAIVVFPGGGYEFTSRREAECIASVYYAAGFNAFVCNYTVGKGRCQKNNPLYDAATAVAHVRRNAKNYNIDPDRIAIIGFSAGGHLAGLLAVKWQDESLAAAVGATNSEMRPNALLLAYPVVTGFELAHAGSFDTLLGEDRTKELTAEYSLELLVTDKCPPAFVWTTSDDDAVPSQNSLMFCAACAAAGVKYELHVFPHAYHGISLATWETNPDWSAEKAYISDYIARWSEWSLRWLESQAFR